MNSQLVSLFKPRVKGLTVASSRSRSLACNLTCPPPPRNEITSTHRAEKSILGLVQVVTILAIGLTRRLQRHQTAWVCCIVKVDGWRCSSW
jgi:hypothetical protein